MQCTYGVKGVAIMDKFSDLVIYVSDDGKIKVDVTFDEGTVWLTQEQIAQLFQKAKSTINEHIRNIFADGELDENVVIRKFRTTTQHGAIGEYRKYELKTLSSVEKDYLATIHQLAKETKMYQ